MVKCACTDPVVKSVSWSSDMLGKAGFPLHLENLEKQGQTWKTWKNRGVLGKNLENYCKTWKKF